MSKTRFFGNLIKTNPTLPTDTAASGVWTLEEAGAFTAAGDWFTPVGPLNFSLAQPLSKKNSDKTETFRFTLGTTF